MSAQESSLDNGIGNAARYEGFDGGIVKRGPDSGPFVDRMSHPGYLHDTHAMAALLWLSLIHI